MRKSRGAQRGVHIAARTLSKADAGSVVVTRTVRDLATGTDLEFRPLGPVDLRGVPGQWELFVASQRSLPVVTTSGATGPAPQAPSR